jgi:hypothetical protein
MWRRSPLLAWLLLTPTLGWGQSGGEFLAGRVVDRNTGAPLAGAVVELPDTEGLRVWTDTAGHFHLPGVSGTVRVRVWRLDYEPLDTLITVPTHQSEITLALSQRPIPLRGLTVRSEAERSSAEAERALFDREVLPGAVGISRREIREIPALGEPDLLRALQALPGVVALNDLSAQLHVWGGAPDQNLVLLDGARIFAPYHMFGIFGAFNTDAVERVEFFRTVLPARRGGGAERRAGG